MFIFDYEFFTVKTSWTLGSKMPQPEKTWLTIKFLNLSFVACSCLSLTFPYKLLIDNWCWDSKNVNYIFGQFFKRCLGSVVSTDKLECAAKFKMLADWRFRATILWIRSDLAWSLAVGIQTLSKNWFCIKNVEFSRISETVRPYLSGFFRIEGHFCWNAQK